MKKIIIRTDGNELIASGHIMRCMAIAKKIQDMGGAVLFALADEKPVEMIREKGFDFFVLNCEWNNWDNGVENLISLLSENKDASLLVDSYYVTPSFFEAVSKVADIHYIDDLNMFPYFVDTIINYNCFVPFTYEWPDEIKYRKPNLLLGGDYVPLREEFSYATYVVNDDVSKILITTGATDRLNMTSGILERLLLDSNLKCLEYHVIVGRFYENREALKDISKRYPNIILHENVTNMSKWMRCCDVAISASGTTLYELCACGIPTICFEIADNQVGAVTWQNKGYMKYAGNGYMDYQGCINNIIDSLTDYRKDKEKRILASCKMQKLVDGNGANRIADYLLKFRG